MVPLCVSTPEGYMVACARWPIVFTQVGAGGGVTAADTGSGDAASSPNDTATSGAKQCFTPGKCGKCCPLMQDPGLCPPRRFHECTCRLRRYPPQSASPRPCPPRPDPQTLSVAPGLRQRSRHEGVLARGDGDPKPALQRRQRAR